MNTTAPAKDVETKATQQTKTQEQALADLSAIELAYVGGGMFNASFI